MKKIVYLIYEDDCGGTFSPFFLTQVFESLKEAQDYKKLKGFLATIREAEYAGTLNLSAYKQTVGGMFCDD